MEEQAQICFNLWSSIYDIVSIMSGILQNNQANL
jgi:hypothetical protein